MQHHDHVLKKWNFDVLTSSPGSDGGVGVSAGKIIATMFLYFVIPFILICNMTMLR